MARWGEDKTLIFVTYYRIYECLWNTSSPLYKNNIARNNAYENLLQDMNDPNLTMKIIKTKIKNLWSVYHTEMKKVNMSKRSGAGTNEVYKPPMAWFAEMQSFMGETDVYRETVGSDLESDASSQHSQSTNDASSQRSQSTNADQSNISQPPTAPTIQTEAHQSRSSSAKRRKVRQQDESVAEALNRLVNLSSAINNRAEEDEFHFFGLNVASQLRQLPLYEALDVQSEIQNILAVARRKNMYPKSAPTLHCIPSIPYTQTNTLSTPNTQSFINSTPIPHTQTNTLSAPSTQSFICPRPIPQTQTNILSAPDTQSFTNSTPISHTQTNTLSVPNSQTIDLLSEAWKLS